MIDPEIINALAAVSSCNVCDALEVLGHPPGFGVIRGVNRVNATEYVMTGIASTATFRAASARPAGIANRELGEQLDRVAQLNGQAVVVFQDLDVPSFGATGGELRCRFYELAGAVGIVTGGTIRDVERIADLAVPVYAAGITCTHGHHYVPDLDVPVTVGGQTVMPGDLIHGDLNGLVSVPASLAAAVLNCAKDVAAIEAELLEKLQCDGATVSSALSARELSKRHLSELRTRVGPAL